MKKILFTYLLFSGIANAQTKFSVGTDVFQMQYKEQRYKFDDYDAFQNLYKNITRVAWGVSYQPFKDKHLYLGIRTNRGINAETRTTTLDTQTSQNVNVTTKIEADSVFVATAIHKNILPYLAITSLHSKTKITYSNGFQVNSKKNSILYGLGFAIPFKEKHSVAFTYFLPNTKYNAKRTFGLSYNYYFAST